MSSDLATLHEVQDLCGKIRTELGRVIVGQEAAIEQLLIALLAGGHCLLVGVPGLAKTLMVRSLADTLGLSFNRIQFTPDLMPSDITGTEIIQEDQATGSRQLKFVQGPVFASVVLADEINRSPPKTQAALLEAMQEQQVTVGGKRHLLPRPFFVLATQNPIEQEGTYPLPEAQLDRFLCEIRVGYPDEDEEFRIVRQTTAKPSEGLRQVVDLQALERMQSLVRLIPVADHVIRFALALTRQTRNDSQSPAIVRKYVTWGAGPRASQFLILAAKARAAMLGRDHADIDEVRAVALPVLRHRLVTNFNAEADGVSVEQIVRELLESTPWDVGNSGSLSALPPVFRESGKR